METILEKTTKKEQQVARLAIRKVEEAKKNLQQFQNGTVTIRLQNRNEVLIIPKKALMLLFNILFEMAEGKSITLLHSEAELSTQQAADLLNVSRPHVVSLLEKGDIPFRKVGAHRRIELKDLRAYEKKLKKLRSEKLKFLTKQAQDLNMGYE